jgi:hypothetical protein
MKRIDYFYASIILGILALIVYGFLNYFGMMVGLIAFSSVFNFVVFLIKTKSTVPVAKETVAEKPIDFYTVGTRTTYYNHEALDTVSQPTEHRKVVNAN